MNNYGVILDEIGMTPFLAKLRDAYVSPFARLLYPEASGDSLDHHHGFIVQYKIGEDLDLDFHYDESEVTLNVCLGKVFTGGSLYFAGLLEDPSTHDEYFQFQHKLGAGILHIGKHRHGALKIKSGERYNLILWCRSSKLRSMPCKHCGGASHVHQHN